MSLGEKSTRFLSFLFTDLSVFDGVTTALVLGHITNYVVNGQFYGHRFIDVLYGRRLFNPLFLRREDNRNL